MSFEIQIHQATLVTVIENTMQQGFRTRCLPSADPFYVDHIDVAAGDTTVAMSDGSVDFVVTVNVFVVTSQSVLAAANDVPDGAKTPVGQATLTLRLSVAGTVLSLTCTGVDLGVIGTFLGSSAATVEQQIQQAVGTVGSLDVGTIVSGIGLAAPSTSRLEIVGSSVLIRFDPPAAGQERLQSGQDWCLFADANTMEALAKSKLNPMLSKLDSFLTSVSPPTVGWAPSGSTPALNVVLDGEAPVPDPFSGHVRLSANVVIGLLHTFILNDGIGSDLTFDVSWQADINLGSALDILLPPGVAEAIESLIVSMLTAQIDPTSFGAVPLGPQEFEMVQPLPQLSFATAAFNYGSVVGLPDGMVLGGSVTTPGTDTSTLACIEGAFPDQFQLLVDCSHGGANSNRQPTLDAVTASAGASFEHAGAVCDIHFVSPTKPPISLSPYLTAPADGTITETGAVALTIPGTVAAVLSTDPQPIQLWLQTARGVRLLDLGTPPSPQLDSEGNVTNCRVVVIDDCPVAVDRWYRVFHMYNPKWSVDPPESWLQQLDRVERFETVLIDVSGLEAGSIVRFDTPLAGLGAGSTFCADGAGHVLLPAMLTARSTDENARLATADRQQLVDVTTATAVFQRVAVLHTPGALAHALAEQGGIALVTSTFADGRTETTRLDRMGIPYSAQPAPGQAGAPGTGAADAPGTVPARAQATTPAQPPDEPGIPGLVALHPVPGFEDSGLQVAELDDGSHVCVVDEAGQLRATGTIPDWPHMPPTGSAWAISASSGDRLAVFAVSRSRPARPARTGMPSSD